MLANLNWKMGPLGHDHPTSKGCTSGWSSKIKSDAMKRTITGLSLIAYFGISIYVGLPLILLNTLIIQMKCFDEIINTGYDMMKTSDTPYFRALNWYLVIITNYFFLGEVFFQHMHVVVKKYDWLQIIVSYHRFNCFSLYLLGIVIFVSLLSRNSLRHQFTLLAWTHFLLIIISAQSLMIVQNTFQGLIWLIVPFALVITNDISAYIFGKWFGRTPLIRLSPKKTVEGFIAAGLSTIIFGILLSIFLLRIDSMACPFVIKELDGKFFIDKSCTPTSFFQKEVYNFGYFKISTYPFVFHAIAMSLFASFIAPFGGFFASGFKRAINIKDFGNVIPGHGGLMDRFDCQYLMATFVNVYISTFIRSRCIDDILRRILNLHVDSQMMLYTDLEKYLLDSGLIVKS